MKSKIDYIKEYISKKIEYKNIDFEYISKSLLIFLPISSLVYLVILYGSFNIQFFYYFNPIDLANTFYYIFMKHIIEAIYLMLIIFLFQFFVIGLESFQILKLNNEIKNFLTPIFCLFISIAINNSIVISGIITILYIGIIFNLFKPTYIFIIVCLLIMIVEKSMSDVRKIKLNKPSFNIINKENKYLLKETKIKKRDYFIGKTTDYIFIYSDNLKKVRVFPSTDIKEINFKQKENQ